MPKVIVAEPTPNENAMKFTIEGRAVDSGSKTFKRGKPVDHPIAEALFGLGEVMQVFLLNDFVTVTKTPDADWRALQQPVIAAIESV